MNRMFKPVCVPLRHSPNALLLVLLVALCTVSGSPSRAQTANCSYSVSPIDFGEISPIDNKEFHTTAIFSARCQGQANARVEGCLSLGLGEPRPSFGRTPRLMGSESNLLQYEIYSDPGHTLRWGTIYSNADEPPPVMRLHLDNNGSANGQQTLYLKVFAGQQTVPLGEYIGDFPTTATNAGFVYQQYNNLSPGCPKGFAAGRLPFKVQANVVEECRVDADDMDFGIHGILGSNIDGATTVRVICTPETSYTISLDNGQNGGSGASRAMVNGDNRISYDLYKDSSRQQVFGSTGGDTMPGMGNGATETISVYGRVPPQATPPAGRYADTVTVTVTY